MPPRINEKAYELRQQRAGLLDEQRVTIERCETEGRAPNEEEDRDLERRYLEMEDLAKRIGQMERLDATERIGPERPGERRFRPLPHEDPDNTRDGKHRYSMVRAARQLLMKLPVDGLEGEVSEELARRTDRLPQGFFMPYRTRTPARGAELDALARDPERRALDTTAGAGSIPTILDKDWIELLRNAMKVKAAGAREFLDLQGKFAIPRQSAAGTAYWVAESGAPTGSNQTLDQVLFTPHTIGAFTDISRKFFELTMLDTAEEFVRMDLTAILARGVDLAALNGSGAANQPLGILQNTAITATGTVALGVNGGAPTWPAIVELHTIVSRHNAADLGPFAYMGNADVKGTFSTTAKIGTTYPVFLMMDDTVYGMPFHLTNQLPNNLTKGTGTGLSPVIGGVWNQLCLGYWSGIDILVDPYTGSSSGTVRIVALQDMDVQFRHPEAFAVIADMVSNQTA
jgi:HK97 family phage major capsid protein